MPVGKKDVIVIGDVTVTYYVDYGGGRRIVDSEDSFPTGAIRAPGRLFMHPDLINVHHVDGDVINAKYLVVVRNTTVSVITVRVSLYTVCICVSVCRCVWNSDVCVVFLLTIRAGHGAVGHAKRLRAQSEHGRAHRRAHHDPYRGSPESVSALPCCHTNSRR